ncbi:MAG TPA: hypothetical protein VGG64_20900 [Pirellulales bacterium]
MRRETKGLTKLWALGVLFVAHHSLSLMVFAAAALAESPPAAAARAALADLRTQPVARRNGLRYLTINSDQEETAIAYVLNAVSRSRLVVRPELAGPGLLRIDLVHYANPRESGSFAELRAAWEKLVTIDPYFHLRSQVVVPLAADREQTKEQSLRQHATKRAAASVSTGSASVTTVTIDGGWIPPDVAAELKVLAVSAGPVLRGDFFVAHAATAPLYYDFAGIPGTEAELLKRLGIDRGVIDKLSADTAANLLVSRVTSKPRRIVRLPGALGGVWYTRDVAVETPDRDPVRTPINYAGSAGRQSLRFDASEWFAQKENGFWLTAVYDAAGKRQDTVVDAIAKDTTAHDGIVRPLVSCVRCHELNGGQSGMQPIEDDQFALLSGEAAVLKSYLPDVARRVQELYDPERLQRAQARDRQDYAAAVEQATGAGPHAAADALARMYANFVDRPVTREVAAAESGLGVEQFVMAMRQSTDPVILALRAGREIKRASYEASFQDVMLRIGSLRGQDAKAQASTP